MTERDKFLLKAMGKEITKPTHGSCCTCQDCGWAYDDCICSDFSEWEHFGILFEWSQKQEWWGDFTFAVNYSQYGIENYLFNFHVDMFDPDTFADKLYKFLDNRL